MQSLASIVAALTFFLMPAPTVLYSTDLTPVVTLPAGYFVLLAEGSPPAGYLCVAYDDLTGLVRETDVRAVDYRPVTKYETTAKFRCDNDGQPVNLRAAPKKSAAVLAVLDSSASGRAYGDIRGEALIAGAGELWYYVAVNGVRGYCYGAHVSVDPTPPNIIEKEPEPTPEVVPTDAEQAPDEQELYPAPTAAVIVLIVALCVPVPFIMFYLFKKPKKDDRS